MSGFRPKAEVAKQRLELPFLARSGHLHGTPQSDDCSSNHIGIPPSLTTMKGAKNMGWVNWFLPSVSIIDSTEQRNDLMGSPWYA